MCPKVYSKTDSKLIIFAFLYADGFFVCRYFVVKKEKNTPVLLCYYYADVLLTLFIIDLQLTLYLLGGV